MMDLDGLTQNLIKMIQTTKTYLFDAFKAYETHNEDVKKMDDDKVDDLERVIEEECLHIILKERPFAHDLRKVTGYFKLVEDIERLGDHAEDIFWCSSNLASEETYDLVDLDNMIDVALKMVTDSFKSVIYEDEKLAQSVINEDDIVDDLYLKVLNELPILKKKKKVNTNFVIYTTLITKYVERIADHASNIAERAIYIKTGYYKNKVII